LRAVLDTVIFVRALLNPRGRWGQLLFDLSDEYVIVLSPPIIEEIFEVIHRPEIKKKLPDFEYSFRLDAVLAKLEEAEVFESEGEITICRDPKDNKFFECGLAGDAQFIISEDRDILDVHEYGGIRTITTAEFLRLVAD
jgi:uncharacterized protein